MDNQQQLLSPTVKQALDSINGTNQTPGPQYHPAVRQALDSINGADNPQELSSTGKGSWNTFIKNAEQIAKQRNFPASVLVGQAALESARGTAAPGNNYFGIKGMGDAGSNNLATQEYGENGYYGENSNFAGYNTPEDAINSYLDLIQNSPRYQGAYQQYLQDRNPNQLLMNIWKSGYATSPTYAQNVMDTPEFKYYAMKEGN